MNLGAEVLPVAVQAEPVPALHGKRPQVLVVVAADVADKTWYLLDLGRVGGGVLAQACCLEDLIRLLHVLIDQTFLVPSQVAEEDSGGLWWLAEDARNLVDLLVLLCLDLGRVKDFEVYFEGLLGGLDVLVLRLKADVILLHVKVRVCCKLVCDYSWTSRERAPSSRPRSLSWSSKSSPLMELLKSSSESILSAWVAGVAGRLTTGEFVFLWGGSSAGLR